MFFLLSLVKQHQHLTQCASEPFRVDSMKSKWTVFCVLCSCVCCVCCAGICCGRVRRRALDFLVTRLFTLAFVTFFCVHCRHRWAPSLLLVLSSYYTKSAAFQKAKLRVLQIYPVSYFLFYLFLALKNKIKIKYSYHLYTTDVKLSDNCNFLVASHAKTESLEKKTHA